MEYDDPAGYAYGYTEDEEEEEEEQDDEARSRTPSGSSGSGRRDERVGDKRDRLRAVLLGPIQSRVAALGGWEYIDDAQGDGGDDERLADAGPAAGKAGANKIYRIGDEVLGCLRDLKRYWRMDDHDDDRNVARIFYETGLLGNDLLPIMSWAGTPAASPRHEKAALASGELMVRCWDGL